MSFDARFAVRAFISGRRRILLNPYQANFLLFTKTYRKKVSNHEYGEEPEKPTIVRSEF